MMSKCGAEFPDIIDFLTEKDDVCTLYIVQSQDLNDELTLKLQDKINNYLSYVLDGQLAIEHPHMKDMKKQIQIDLQHEPKGVAAEFLNTVGSYINKEGFNFKVQVGANA